MIGSFFELDGRFQTAPMAVVAHLGRIDRSAGQADLYRQQLPGLLDALRTRARVESVEASSAIEGVVAPHARAEAVILNAEEQPRNRTEEELRGYANALTYVFDEATREGRISVGLILHLHRLLYEPTGLLGAGQFKTSDNVVVDRVDGQRRVRFTPVGHQGTPQATRDLVDAYTAELARGVVHPLLLVGAFLLDFTVIHPFADGNGRVSRLLANLLLSQTGYHVGRYVSIERRIEQSRDRYYDVLLASTAGWHESRHDVWPWLTYFAEVVAETYELFVTRAEAVRGRGSKQERVRAHILEHAAQSFTIGDLRAALPGVSEATMRMVLQQLRREGVLAGSTGRGAVWRKAPPA